MEGRTNQSLMLECLERPLPASQRKVGSPTLHQRHELRCRCHDPDHLVPNGFDKLAKVLGEEELILGDRYAETPLSRHPHRPLLEQICNAIDR